MPRTVKREPQDSELKYTCISLEKLNRRQIQELAKKESIKANMSTQKIIAALLKLFRGPEEDIVAPETVQDEVEPTVAGIQEENCAPKLGSRHDGPSAATSQPALQSVSSSHKSGSPVDAGRQRSTPYPYRRPSRSRSPQASGSRGIPASVKASINPTDKDIRDVRRRLTALNNEQVSLKDKVGKMQRHLAFSSGTLEQGTRFLEEMSWRREALEDGVAIQLPYTRHLWDGSVHMAEADRKQWRRFVAENRRPHGFIQADSESESEGEVEGETMGDDEEDDAMAAGEVRRALVEDDDYDGEDIY